MSLLIWHDNLAYVCKNSVLSIYKMNVYIIYWVHYVQQVCQDMNHKYDKIYFD